MQPFKWFNCAIIEGLVNPCFSWQILPMSYSFQHLTKCEDQVPFSGALGRLFNLTPSRALQRISPVLQLVINNTDMFPNTLWDSNSILVYINSLSLSHEGWTAEHLISSCRMWFVLNNNNNFITVTATSVYPCMSLCRCVLTLTCVTGCR